MQMKLTGLKRFACKTATLAMLVGAFPMAVIAAPSTYRVSEGESRVYRMDGPIKRVAVGNPEIADYIILKPTELYLLGKKTGATNLIVWDKNGNSASTPLQVSRNVEPIKDLIRTVLPNETDIHLYSSGPALVLAGTVSNSLAAETAYRLVKGYLGGDVPADNPEKTLTNTKPSDGYAGTASLSGIVKSASIVADRPTDAEGSGMSGVVNLLKVRDAQQVRLEVHIAEVSKAFMQALGFEWAGRIGDVSGGLMTGFVSNENIKLLLKDNTSHSQQIKAENERDKGWIKILAEPTIVAMSGQEGYFLVGGKIYIPTITANGAVDYQERTYGVGLRFTPTVLDAGRISLKVAPEVSEPPTSATDGTGTLLAFKTSYASTTVQMNEGQNLVIGGLFKDKITETLKAVPLLGDIPLLGALFRHTKIESENTEILVVVRPTLVKASDTPPELPTDRFIPPTQKELFFDGKLQGSRSGQ